MSEEHDPEPVLYDGGDVDDNPDIEFGDSEEDDTVDAEDEEKSEE